MTGNIGNLSPQVTSSCHGINAVDFSRDALITRLSAAMQAERDKNPKEIKRWRGELAELCGVDVRTVDRWTYAESAPEANQLLLLFARFGADFENAVRTSEPQAPNIESDADVLSRVAMLIRAGKLKIGDRQ